MFFKKKKQEDLEEYRDITDDVEESDFVPYSCLYNEHTVLTKNGELLQTIALPGPVIHSLNDESSIPSLRDAIRLAVKKYITSDCYAIWIHTVRREENYALPTKAAHPFAAQIEKEWEEQNRFSKQFTNEVFITIVREGHDADIISTKDFIRGIIPSRDIKWHNTHLDSLYEELNATVNNILSFLSNYGSRRLGIYQENGVYYSDSLSFLEKIINLIDRKMPVADIDLAHYLTTSEITFAFNAMEVRRSDGRRRFASILTIKEYKEKSLHALDNFLKGPIEYIVTQCVDFINPTKALEKYKNQKKYMQLSGDTHLSELTEIDLILDSDNGNPCDFGQQQLTIFLLADNVRQLENYTRRAMNFMAKSGIIAIREDIHFEECYWAQLPGNFEFIRRLIPTNTSHIAGFTNVSRYPTGQSKGNHWGEALTTLYSHTGTPYFFNFHEGTNGHSLIAGSTHARRRELLAFLLTMSQKYQPRIHIISVHKDLERLASTLGGITHHYSTEANATSNGFNLFQLRPTEGNITFLTNWLLTYAAFTGTQVTNTLKDGITMTLHASLPQWQNMNFQSFIELLSTHVPSAPTIFNELLPSGTLSALLFNKPSAIGALIHMHDVTEITSKNTIFAPYISLLLQYITENLDGRPTILVLDDGLEWIRYTSFGNIIQQWLQALTQRNAMCLFLSNAGNFHQNNNYTSSLIPQLATGIYLSNPKGLDAYPNSFGLSETEQEFVDVMQHHIIQFLIKKRHETVISGIDLHTKCEALKDIFKEPMTTPALLGGVSWNADDLQIASAGRIT